MLRRIILAAALICVGLITDATGQGPGLGLGGPNFAIQPAGAGSPQVATGLYVYDPMNYGAKCDGTTNDTAAINAMFTAIRAANLPFTVEYPGSLRCRIQGTINATNLGGNVVTNGLVYSKISLRLLCDTAGLPCIDAFQSRWVDWDHLYISTDSNRTSSVTSLTIGAGSQSLTVGTGQSWLTSLASSHGSIEITSIADQRNNMLGTVTSYNSGTGALVINVTTANGSGTIAAWTVGTDPNIGIQIGIATSSDTAAHNHFQFPRIDGNFTLTPFLNIGSEVLTMEHPYLLAENQSFTTYPLIEDGYNHWNVQSQFVTVTLTQDSWVGTFNEQLFQGGTYYGGPLWVGAPKRMQIQDGYCGNPTGYGVILWGSAVGGPQYTTQLDVDCHFEAQPGLTDVFYVDGPNTTAPIFRGLHYHEHAPQPSTSIFKVNTANITGVTVSDFDVRIATMSGGGNAVVLFNDPTLWTATGHVSLPNASNWTQPAGGAIDLELGPNASTRSMVGSTLNQQAPPQQLASVAGNSVSITASDATAGSGTNGAAAGGSVTITAGGARRLNSGNADGGPVSITGGSGDGGPGNGGTVTLTGGLGGNQAGKTGGGVTLVGASILGSSTTALTGGPISSTSGAGSPGTGNGNTAGNSGTATFATGVGGTAAGTSGSTVGGNSGAVTIQSGNAGAATASASGTGGNSGSVTVTTGTAGAGGSANGVAGNVVVGPGATTGNLQFKNITASSAAAAGTYCGSASGAGTSTVTIDTTVACLTSSEALKNVVPFAPFAPYKTACEEEAALKPIGYRWKPDAPKADGDPGEHIGFGAFATAYVDERLIVRDRDGNPRAWRPDAVAALAVACQQEMLRELAAIRAAK